MAHEQTGPEGALAAMLGTVGPRLRSLRTGRKVTLANLSGQTGISVSTLSRLESGLRRPTLELLLPLAQAYGVTLDDLVDAPTTGDPRVHLDPVTVDGVTYVPLTPGATEIVAYKMIIEPGARSGRPDLRTHEGYEWCYVLTGRLRLVLGHRDLVMGPGEAAEFDTRVPHWFGPADDEAVELLSLFGEQGQRTHTRVRPRRPAQEP
ncbi:helix-turn-helix domain-containing protein [Isoptericola halotolerans]|uniref:Transcriptional regulator with XRE-family HTH domain n=1 Tax=Isoptericola halotolerans TaxID=300560 RepID=A0ABX2A1J7_9MICO|nr:XRE family transcriptional regulator [Isoptericola halotolerans]NOV96727.1 transcriptional regulator with XRE-family HTH domain [Isoptericola halotolerans]